MIIELQLEEDRFARADQRPADDLEEHRLMYATEELLLLSEITAMTRKMTRITMIICRRSTKTTR